MSFSDSKRLGQSIHQHYLTGMIRRQPDLKEREVAACWVYVYGGKVP